MVSSKYYVYGGGRWRELDTATGRVSGWRGARLCVARRGRLVVRRGPARRRLLAALGALAAGRPSAARLGPRLARQPPRRDRTPSRSRQRCRCCCHRNNNRCEGKCSPGPTATAGRSQRSLTADVCVQTAPPAPLRRPHLAFPPSTTAARRPAVGASPTARNTSTSIKKPPHTAAISPTKRRNSSTSWRRHRDTSSDSTEPFINKINTSPTKKTNLSQKRKRSDSESSDTSEDEVAVSQSILKKDFNVKYLRPRKSARLDPAPPSRGPPALAPPRGPPAPLRDRPPRIRTRIVPGQVVSISSDDQNKDPVVNLASLKYTRDTETDKEKTKRNKSVDIFSQKSRNNEANVNIYRELEISEEEVEVLRSFMLRTDPRFDLYRYDHDDGYKARFFYSLNPLVNLERCPRILALLEGRRSLALRQFASQLGLRSVSDASDRPSPRTRSQAYVYIQDDTDSEDEENVETTMRRSLRHNTSKPKVKPHSDQGDTDSEDKENVETTIKRSLRPNTIKPKAKSDRDQGDTDSEVKENEEITIRRSLRHNMSKSKEKPDSDQGDTDSEDKENLEITKRRSLRHNTSKPKAKPDRDQGKVVGREKEKVHDDVSKIPPAEVTVNVERLRGRGRSGGDGQGKDNPSDKLKRNNSQSRDDDEAANEKRQRRERKLQEYQNSNTGEGRKRTNYVVKESVKAVGTDNWYSALEDAAIVAWISVGSRASLVNGNRVWRELEAEYEAVGGRPRSWHSLRNRYLRSLLPALGRLALPPAQQARLRAAAAHGEIKNQQRRNSIYGPPPPVGASSRAPPRPARSPRYSQLTRQFAARHPPVVSSSSEFEAPKSHKSNVRNQAKSPASSVNSPRLRPRTPAAATDRATGPPSPELRSRTRKLYNPNKL